ncbi:alpha/beta hydrolase [Pseudomonas sp. NBRC 111119]|uniref:alpha/beta hydrolase n=1 Tax=Pseudomonas sp. NBRC 111119 TaxID=1661034 RepID=UPI0007619A68|nr:alpha/beta hydrolase [Pseudomonas sp. NBRC 111119]
MALNPDIAAYLELVDGGRAAGRRNAMHLLSAQEARRQFDLASQMMDAGGIELAQVDDLQVPARDGHALAARLYSASRLNPQAPAATVLYLHGGGYVVGSLDSHDGLCRALAESGEIAVLSIAYRCAPEWRFPTAVYDAEDAWAWLASHGQAYGLDPKRLAVAGDSVGGSLATVLANRLASVMAPVQPLLQVLIYPVTDASRQRASIERYASGYLLEKQTLEWFYDQYQSVADDRLDPRFSPLLGKPAQDAAPVLMLLAECDPLYDEGVAYAEHLRTAGARVELCVYEGMTHDFLRMGAIVEEAQQAQGHIVRALVQALA